MGDPIKVDELARLMIALSGRVAGTDVNHWWDDGANAIAFSRGAKGFVALSRASAVVSASVATGMPPGTYCDVLTGGRSGAACVGTSIVVDPAGAVALRLEPNTAIAIDADTRLP